MSNEVSKSQEEVELEKLVFGDSNGINNALTVKFSSSDSDEVSSGDETNGGLFYIDEQGEGLDKFDSDAEISSSAETSLEDKPLWSDSDDEKLLVSIASSARLKKLRQNMDERKVNGKEYQKRLRAQFLSLHPQPSWAKQSKSHQDETDENSSALKNLLAKQTTYLAKGSSRLLPASRIAVSRLQDANKQHVPNAVIQSLDFHPQHPLLLTAGFDKALRIYHIDGKVNPIATSLYVNKTPFKRALFHRDGRRVFAGGKRRYMCVWDIESGSVEQLNTAVNNDILRTEKFIFSSSGEYLALSGEGGSFKILSAITGQNVASGLVEEPIADFVWNTDNELTIASTSGDVFIWDAKVRQFSRRWRDIGIVNISSIAKNDKYTALGLSSGVVSIYNHSNPSCSQKFCFETESWEPNFVLENLVTSITDLRFSNDGQILAMATSHKRDALKLVHVPSFSVFQNWPTPSTPLGRVTALAFSPGTQMLCTGNMSGNARLWSLNHYST